MGRFNVFHRNTSDDTHAPGRVSESHEPKMDGAKIEDADVAVTGADAGRHDAVWGEIGEGGPDYRSLGWIRAAVLETKTQIGLGVLGLVRE